MCGEQAVKKEVNDKLEDIVSSAHAIDTRITELEATNEVVSHLSDRVAALETNLLDSHSSTHSQAASVLSSIPPNTLESTLREFEERRRRSLNVIVMGIAKLTNATELQELAQIISLLPDLLQAVRAHRLGEIVPGRPCLLKITFSSTDKVLKVLKSKAKQPNRFKNDYTIQAGEDDETIKYIKSIPTNLDPFPGGNR